jgi:hypothetical protein
MLKDKNIHIIPIIPANHGFFKLFMAKGHTRYFGLVRGPQVQK